MPPTADLTTGHLRRRQPSRVTLQVDPEQRSGQAEERSEREDRHEEREGCEREEERDGADAGHDPGEHVVGGREVPASAVCPHGYSVPRVSVVWYAYPGGLPVLPIDVFGCVSQVP